MGGYGGSGGGSQAADAQWRSPAPASSGASASTAQGTPKRTWSGQVEKRVMKQKNYLSQITMNWHVSRFNLLIMCD